MRFQVLQTLLVGNLKMILPHCIGQHTLPSSLMAIQEPPAFSSLGKANFVPLCQVTTGGRVGLNTFSALLDVSAKLLLSDAGI